jgi:hypothetical protein
MMVMEAMTISWIGLATLLPDNLSSRIENSMLEVACKLIEVIWFV